ncbi:MAG: Gfo/Idh/MocA family oxidoreductase [Candidatus Firestonebacteria bacterium]
MRKLSFALIGCGDIAEQEAQAIIKSKNSTLTIVMDVNKEYAENFGKKYNIPNTTDLKEVLARKDIDAVVIAVPHYLHKSVAIESAKAGKHIIVEKPVATNLQDADEMIGEAKKAGVKLSVAYVLRCQPMVDEAKRLVEKGAIGKVINITIQSMGYKPESYWTQGWRKTVTTDWRTSVNKSGGGVLIMNVSHYIDMLYHITGLEVERIYSEFDTFATKVEVEDMIVVIMRYKNGALGMIQTSSTAFGGGETTNRIYGTQGQIILSANPFKVYVSKEFEGLVPNQWNEVALEKMEDEWLSPRINYINKFSDAILNNKDVPIPGEEGKKSMEIVLSAYEAGRKHKPI